MNFRQVFARRFPLVEAASSRAHRLSERNDNEAKSCRRGGRHRAGREPDAGRRFMSMQVLDEFPVAETR